MEENSIMKWIEMIIACISFVVSIINLFFYIRFQGKYNESAKTQTLTAQGAIETQIRNSISDASKEVRHCAIDVEKHPQNKVIMQAYLCAEEMYRNAYEDACAKYIDGKIDKERFEKMYKQEIYKLVNDEKQAEYYSKNQTPYSSTVAVYKQWFSQA